MTRLIKDAEYLRLTKAANFAQTIERGQQFLSEERRRKQAFYDMVTPSMKAEFIEGEIVLHSPATHNHNFFMTLLTNLAKNFTSFRRLGRLLVEKAMIELHRSSYEPDIAFWKKEKSDLFTGEQLIFPAPDFVVEILSKSTQKNDRGIKLIDYALNGIAEYWIIDPDRQRVEQYVLLLPSDTTYTHYGTFQVGEDITSKVIEGFEIPVKAIFDETANNEALQKILSGEI
jgi:Uma2 family endonuclease